MQAREHLDSGNIVERVCLPLMAHQPADRKLVITRALEGLVVLESRHELKVKYAGFVFSYAALEEHEKPELIEKFIDRSPYGKDIMTLADILHREGEAEGMAKGKAEGKAEGRVEGRIASILELYKEGHLSAQVARAKLIALSKEEDAPSELIKNALLKFRK
jgi:hypothetical protein